MRPSFKRSVIIGLAAGRNLYSLEYLHASDPFSVISKDEGSRDKPIRMKDFRWLVRCPQPVREPKQECNQKEEASTLPRRGSGLLKAWIWGRIVVSDLLNLVGLRNGLVFGCRLRHGCCESQVETEVERKLWLCKQQVFVVTFDIAFRSTSTSSVDDSRKAAWFNHSLQAY